MDAPTPTLRHHPPPRPVLSGLRAEIEGVLEFLRAERTVCLGKIQIRRELWIRSSWTGFGFIKIGHGGKNV